MRSSSANRGTGVIDRLAAGLWAAFPGMRGLSRRNVFYMGSFAGAFSAEIVQQSVAHLPWGHVTVLLDKLDTQAERDFYAAAAAEQGWSRNVLRNQL